MSLVFEVCYVNYYLMSPFLPCVIVVVPVHVRHS